MERLIGLAGSLLLFVAGILRRFLSKEITDELHVRIPCLTRKLIERASNRTVKWNVEPRPSLLSTQIRPPIK